jgi:uncharacterized protein (TIGR02217 family)
MPITVLADMILPNALISGELTGAIRRTNTRIAHGDTGYLSINAVSAQALREYTVNTVPMRLEGWQILQSFHEITFGGAYGFLIEDPADCVAKLSSIALMPAVGTTPAYYQLQRRYVEPKSGRYWDRPVTRPQATSFQLFNADGSVFTGTHSLDPDTGRITASSDPSTLKWSGRFYVPVHFQQNDLNWKLVAPGGYDQRFVAGDGVVLQEIRE